MDPYAPKHCPVKEACQFSSPLITVDQFKEQCWDMIGPEISLCLKNEKGDLAGKSAEDLQDIASILNTDEQTIQELKEVCSIDNLKCEYDKYDLYKMRAYKDFPDDLPLETVKICKLDRTKQEELSYAQHFMEPVEETFTEEDKLLPPGEVLLCVSVYHPTRRRPQQVFNVHSSQKLTELKDAINCPSDKIILGEQSNNPDLTGAKTAKETTGSSFFMVENIFYNDTRSQLNRDYSKTIMDWAKEAGRHTVPGLGLFESAIMEDRCFKDVKIRLGYPYLYCHQGNCEHIVVFLDMRLINEQDVMKASSYPVQVMEGRKKRGKCSVCNIHMIKWKTTNDHLAFEDPGYFCDKCFRYLHYDQEGKKLYQFEAYPCVDMEQ